ncbi:hypothetical protein YC2023_079742 [Brassica napus]
MFYCKLCYTKRKLLDKFIKYISSKKHLSEVSTFPLSISLSFCNQYICLTILGKSRRRVLLIVVDVPRSCDCSGSGQKHHFPESKRLKNAP